MKKPPNPNTDENRQPEGELEEDRKIFAAVALLGLLINGTNRMGVVELAEKLGAEMAQRLRKTVP